MNKLVNSYRQLHQFSDSDLSAFKSSKQIVEHSGSLFTDFDEFVKALDEIALTREEITIHPDFDVDGVSGGVTAKVGLDALDISDQVNLYYPKSSNGYGLTVVAVDEILDQFPKTKYIFTVDNGINTKDAVDYAVEKGLIVIVTDHHDGQLHKFPDRARVVVCPKRVDKQETYPFVHVSGTTVTWKLLMAYAELRHKENALDILKQMKPFSGLSIISDVMPTVNENRRILKETIQMLNDKQYFNQQALRDDAPISFTYAILGFKRLIELLVEKGHMESGKLNDVTLGFRIAPILNSPRRMLDDSTVSFQVFTEPMSRAEAIAFEINETRKEEIAHVGKLFNAEYTPDKLSEMYGVVVQLDYVRHGIAGLIAGNISNTHHLPTIVLSHDFGGSARSPYAYDLQAILSKIEESHPEYFITWGGHAQAAGLKLDPQFFDEFVVAFNDGCKEYLRNVKVDDRVEKEKAIPLDATNLPSVEEVVQAMEVFESIKPYSFEVPEPKFKVTFDYMDAQEKYMSDGKHVKFTLYDKSANSINVIVWGQGENAKAIDPYRDCEVTVSGLLDLNEFRSRKSVQLTSTVMSVRYLDEETT